MHPIFKDGICPKCGELCGNGGSGPLRCACGWVQDEREAAEANDWRYQPDVLPDKLRGMAEILDRPDNDSPVIRELLKTFRKSADAIESLQAQLTQAAEERERIKTQMCQFCRTLDKKAGISPVCAASCEWRGAQKEAQNE